MSNWVDNQSFRIPAKAGRVMTAKVGRADNIKSRQSSRSIPFKEHQLSAQSRNAAGQGLAQSMYMGYATQENSIGGELIKDRKESGVQNQLGVGQSGAATTYGTEAKLSRNHGFGLRESRTEGGHQSGSLTTIPLSSALGLQSLRTRSGVNIQGQTTASTSMASKAARKNRAMTGVARRWPTKQMSGGEAGRAVRKSESSKHLRGRGSSQKGPAHCFNNQELKSLLNLKELEQYGRHNIAQMEKQLAGSLTLVPDGTRPHARIPSHKGQSNRLDLTRDQGAIEHTERPHLRPAESEPVLQTHQMAMGEGALAPVGLFEDALASSFDRGHDLWEAPTKSLDKSWMRKFFVKRSNLAGSSQGKRLQSAYPGGAGSRSQFSLGAHDATIEQSDQQSASSQFATNKKMASRNKKLGLQPSHFHDSATRDDPYMSFQTTGYKSVASFGSQSAIKRPRSNQLRGPVDVESSKKFRKKFQQQMESKLLKQVKIYDDFARPIDEAKVILDSKQVEKMNTMASENSYGGTVGQRTAQRLQDAQQWQTQNTQSTLSKAEKPDKGNSQMISSKKKLTIYQKKEIEFQKLYEEKLIELREKYQQAKLTASNPNSTQRSPAASPRQEITIEARDEGCCAQAVKSNTHLPKKKQDEFKLADINIFQARDKNYKIISNRVRILARKEQKRRYVHKDQQQLHYCPKGHKTERRVKITEVVCGKCKKNIEEEHYFHCASCPKDKYLCSEGHMLEVDLAYLTPGHACHRCQKQIELKQEYYYCMHNSGDVEAYHKDCVSHLRKDQENYHKNCTILEQTFGFDPYFDPIRTKLRVMPVERAPQIQGKTADFYFIQASNLCLRNNLTQAIESLTKGLAIQPDHLLCRFNHGALMFKLGLMSQARRDFEMLSSRYPKELAVHFNLALTLLQLGEYDKALDAADVVVKAAQKADGRQQVPSQRQEQAVPEGPKSQQNTSKDSEVRSEHIELLYDTHMLRAQCFWRTETTKSNDGSERYNALEAVRNFNIAHRYNANSRRRRAPALAQDELLCKLRDLQYKEMRLDIKEEADWAEARRSKTFVESSMSQIDNLAGKNNAYGEAHLDHLQIQSKKEGQPSIVNDPRFANTNRNRFFKRQTVAFGASGGIAKQAQQNLGQQTREQLRQELAPEMQAYYGYDGVDGVATGSGASEDCSSPQTSQKAGPHEQAENEAQAPAIDVSKVQNARAKNETVLTHRRASEASSPAPSSDEKTRNPKSSTKFQQNHHSKQNTKHRSAGKLGHHRGQASPQRLSHSNQQQLVALKTQLIQRQEAEAKIKAVVFNTKAQEFYHQFREDQIKIIDQGHRGRFDVMYKHLLKPIHDKLNAEFCSHYHHHSSVQGQEEENQRLLKKMAELNKALTKQHEGQLTHEEAKAIQSKSLIQQWLRKHIDEENSDEDDNKVQKRGKNKNQKVKTKGTSKQEAAVDEVNENEDNEQRFMELMMQEDNSGKHIKNREISGADFSSNGIREINVGQAKLETVMDDFQAKFEELSRYWTREIARQDRKIFQNTLKHEDLHTLGHVKGNGKGQDEAVDADEPGGDPLIAVLKEHLKSRTQLPDDLCNILQLDLDEKAKLRRLRSQHEENQNVRLSQKRCALIKEEFDTFKGSARATKVLDALLKGLKFFARFNESDRRTVYEHAEYLSLPARTEIFKEGDEGDRMYVILKGRVAVEKLQYGPRNLPIIVALLKDGEHFGELGLIDQDKIDKQTKDSYTAESGLGALRDRFSTPEAEGADAQDDPETVSEASHHLQEFDQSTVVEQDKLRMKTESTKEQNRQQPGRQDKSGLYRRRVCRRYATRKASCITAEDTELLVLDLPTCHKLYQPEKKKKSSPSPTKMSQSGSTVAAESEGTSKEQDQLSKKILFLRSISYFSDIEPELLMPIAVNIIPKTYSYGEYIIKQGEIPQGLIIIAEGQCAVVATRPGERRLPEKKQGGTTTAQSNAAEKDGIRKKQVTDPALHNFDAETSVLNQVNFMEKGYQNCRVLVDEDGQEIKDRMEYEDFMVFNHLMRGNHFGGRVLVPFEHYQSRKRLYFGESSLDRYLPADMKFHAQHYGATREQIKKESEEHYQMKSYLSVVATSAKVEVWIIDRTDAGFLPEKAQEQVLEKVIHAKEEDRPCPEQDLAFIIDQFQKWDGFKMDCVESLFERKALEQFMVGKKPWARMKFK